MATPRVSATPALRVLVIDDEPDIVDMLVFGLSQRGFEVSTATCGEEAIAQMALGRYDLAISDLRMPGMDGLATARALRAIDPDLDIILATGYLSEEMSASCAGGLVTASIRKPFSLSELEALIGRVHAR